METALPEGLHMRIRATSGLERFKQELRNRFQVIGSFVNDGSCLGLASVILMETRDEW